MSTFRTALLVAQRRWGYVLAYLFLLSLMGVLTAAPLAGHDSDQLKQVGARVAVVDRDSSQLSHGLARFVATVATPVTLADSRQEWQDAMAKDRLDLLIVVPHGFGADFLASVPQKGASLTEAAAQATSATPLEIYQAPYSAAAGLSRARVETFLNQTRGYLATVASGPEQAMELAAQSSAAQASTTLLPGRTDSIPLTFETYARFSTYPLFTFTVVMAATIMLTMNRAAMRSRLLASPSTSLSRGAGLLGACFLIGLVAWLWLLGLGLAVFGRSLSAQALPQVGVIAASMFATTMVGVAVGYLVGQAGASENGANLFGNLFGLILSFTSGAWLAMEMLPQSVVVLAHFTPTYWATLAVTEATNSTTATASALAPLYGYVGIAMLFAVAIASVGLAVGRSRARVEL
ncbi:ABC transporter permease [Buchananella felis]|uniref:ABC transporter permease n=1 Tax=Buchananella felis TaxID=3231492 RepID=UPI003529A31D